MDAGHSAALLNTDALQSAIFKSANFSSIATDATGVIQIFNVGAALTGCTRDELIGAPFKNSFTRSASPRDAMPDGGSVTIETADAALENSSFHKESIVKGRYMMLAISDTGNGMTKETQGRLFEPFFTTKETGKGTGLGLSTTYGIVKQSKGYIWVYSELGLGTTFKVYLPQADRTIPLPAPGPVVALPVKRASETVLLVEDEAGVRRLSRRILENAGYRVLEAANGDDAEKAFARQGTSIDLVITDVIMPGCGGPELLGRLQLHAPALKVLYMSGYTEQSAAHQAGLGRGLPFVQKPFTASEFQRHVRDALDR
jgi:CheY-like chemotaxis protein